MTNAKGGTLEGGALTEEVIESSSSVLQMQGLNTKGLQQFYSPVEMARLVKALAGRNLVMDLTAGDGSLLCALDRFQRYGIEIDADQIGAGDYTAIQGDTQHVAPLLQEIGARFAFLALNPPYGLKWTDPTINEGEPTNSALVTYRYGLNLLQGDGMGLMLCGGSSKYDEIAEELDGIDSGSSRYVSTVWAVLHVPDMFDDVRSGTDVVFFGYRNRHDERINPWRAEIQRSALNERPTIEKLEEMRAARTPYRRFSYTDGNRADLWMKAAQEEYDRRTKKRIAKRKSEFDVYGAKKQIRVDLRPFTALKLARSSAGNQIKYLDKMPLEYFVLNGKEWENVLLMDKEETISVEPALVKRVEKMIVETKREIVPMYEVKPQQRLAWLQDVDKVLCTTTDKERKIEAGEEYPIHVQTVVKQSRERARPVQNKKTGDITLKDFIKERKVLNIRINGHHYDESSEDIQYLIDHFAVPDPGTIADLFPHELAEATTILDRFESGRAWKFKAFQKDDIARLMVKGGGLLAWEQGLGKTLAGGSFAKGMIEQGAKEAVLIIAPQDLIKYWQSEMRKFYGIEIEWLRAGQDFRDARDHIKAGGKGWYITHYEALSRSGGGRGASGKNVPAQEQETPLGSLKYGYKLVEHDEGGSWALNPDTGRDEYVTTPARKELQPITDATRCPSCGCGYREIPGYDPNTGCRRCGWVRYSRRVKPNYDTIKSTFRHGIVIIDELTKIKGDYALRSKAIRGIKAGHVLGMTGTPIKNYIPDSFWGLWKCLGNASPRFPYDYAGGKTKYENDFAVIEYQMSNYRREARKVLPEVSNLLVLWKLLAAAIIRKRKEETGETLVSRTFYPTAVPLGVRQAAAMNRWLKSFGQFFREMNPDHPVVAAGMEETMAAMLGQGWKLEFAATMPEADPDRDYWVDHEQENLRIKPVSNWTPANARVLELALHHAAKGDKVLIGSDIKMPGRWMVDELKKRGVAAANILKDTDGHPETKSPAARAKVVEKFQKGEISVLVATCEALNLGHNLDKGNVVILSGLPWDFATADQFIARIHRLTSKLPVKVYVVVPNASLTERKWKLLIDKGAAAQMALDGRLIEADEEQIDQGTILKQMVEAGIPVDGSAVEEDDIEAAWDKIKSADDLPELILDGVAVEDLEELRENTEEEEIVSDDTSSSVPSPEAESEEPLDGPDLDEMPEHEWRAEVDTGEGTWYSNAIRRATYDEARADAVSLASRWTLVRDWRVVNEETPLRESTVPVDCQEPDDLTDERYAEPEKTGREKFHEIVHEVLVEEGAIPAPVETTEPAAPATPEPSIWLDF